MKLFKFTTLLLTLCLCLASVSALAATEEDARALMTECGIGVPVAEGDNLMGISLKDVRYDNDGDVYIQWAFTNEIMRKNLTYAFIQMRFFDPADLAAPYSAFKISENNKLNLTFKEGDSINILDFAHLSKDEFNPESGVIFMYFNGSGEGAPEELFTRPLVFAVYVGDDGPHAVETTPRYAPETIISAFSGS